MKAKLGILASIMVFGACNKPDPSFDVASLEQSFLVAPDVYEEQQKIDVLWVIDNSGSMRTSQQRLSNSFAAFIQNFTQKRYDYRIAVTTTDAYRGRFVPADSFKRILRQTAQGESYLSPLTMDIENKFSQLVQVGVTGHGDERAFQSIEDTLKEPLNQNFRRSDAFLAIIIVSDEDDFSHNAANSLDNQYQNASLVSPTYYHSLLNTLTGGAQNNGVYSISILNETCRNSLNDAFTERKISRRYQELVTLSNGANASLCEDFSLGLSFIADTIVKRNPPRTTYTLVQEPIINSIQVTINGDLILQDTLNGWIYDSTSKNLTLNGQSAQLIQDGGKIQIKYDPKNPFNQ